jgi:1,4-dihydroxy-2-naphthoyl-CoA hydrolase
VFSAAYTVRLRDTDAAGLLYFTEQLRVAHEAFEGFLEKEGFGIGHYLRRSTFLLPIVHAEADYSAPLFPGDQLAAELSCARIGNSSFTLRTRLRRAGDGGEVGTVKIVHCAVNRATGKTIPLPDEIKELLVKLGGPGARADSCPPPR